MLSGFSNKSADAGTPSIEPVANLLNATHLLHTVQRVLNSQHNTQITLAGMGNITILPQLRQFHAEVEDMRAFSIAPIESFEIKLLNSSDLASIAQIGRDIKDLLWQLAFHIYADSLIEGCSENDVIQFSRWPNITRLPTTPNTARICALLTRHPTSITLVRRVLGIDKHEVSRVISAAVSAGIVNTISRGPSLVSFEPAVAEVKPEQSPKAGLWNSLFAKISSL